MSLTTVARKSLRNLSRFTTASDDHHRRIADDMIRRAQAAAASRRYWEAAFLYAEAARLRPGEAGLHVQCGHMFKECGDLAAAQPHYETALALNPQDADLALQLGHFHKCAGRLDQARHAYLRAAKLGPEWSEPLQELEGLRQAGWRRLAQAGAEPVPAGLDGSQLAHELAPRRPQDVLHGHQETIEMRRLGRRERTHWGVMPTLRGVEAVRGCCINAIPILIVELIVNDRMIYRAGVSSGFALAHEGERPELRKYVFNAWLDLSGFVSGRYEFECRLTDIDRHTKSWTAQIVIAPPLDPAAHADSDGVAPAPDPDDPRSLEEQIRSAPTMVRSGRRSLLRASPRTVLVQRVDQLGDMVCSVPALKRLRELLPQARLVGLLSKANADLGRTLGVFDEIITIDFPHSDFERRRVMSLDAQQSLAQRLKAYGFDMAIDLSESVHSRLLLTLSGAPVLVGFPSDEVPGLTIDVIGYTHDRWNGHEIVSHANKQLGLVEWLGAMLRTDLNVVRRGDLNPGRLAAFGLPQDSRFIVLHDGARLQFSRWPPYLELARLILDRTDLHLVMLTDDDGMSARTPAELAGSDRFHLIDRRLAFDDLDALLSFCAAFVGNDSGPKHLASLRGAEVISLHMARNNWNEWGQDSGHIMSRRLPCAGCMIQLDPEECGKDHACIRDIRPEEVFAVVERVIG